MDKNDQIKRILEDEDYIKCAKFCNSMAKYVDRYSEGVENNIIAKLLSMSEEEVEKIYQESVEILRKDMVK